MTATDQQQSLFDAAHDRAVGPDVVDSPLIPRNRARARTTDPDTSHAAAASITGVQLRESQLSVLRLFRLIGDMTDEQLLDAAGRNSVRQSPSGLRTRRRELVDLGRLRDTGDRVLLNTGRRAIVWGLAS